MSRPAENFGDPPDQEEPPALARAPPLAYPDPQPVLNVVPTLPYVLVLDNVPESTSHTDLEKLIHEKLPPSDVPDKPRFHVLDISHSRATVEFARFNLAHVVADALHNLEIDGCTVSCSVLDNPSVVTAAPDITPTAPTPPQMPSVNPFMYMSPMYMDCGYYGPGPPGPGIYSRPNQLNPGMPSGMPVQRHPGVHGVHSMPSMGAMPGYPQPYYYGGQEVPNMAYPAVPGAYAPSYPLSRRLLTRLSSNFSRTRSSRNSSFSLNRQGSNLSFRRFSNLRHSSLSSVPGRTNSSILDFGKGDLTDYTLPESPGGEEAEEKAEKTDQKSEEKADQKDERADERADEKADDEGMVFVDDENGQRVRVDPRRLFVGNIPFNSTWPALKNFLVSKSEEIEPNNDIEILKVEIPMQPPRELNPASTMGSYYYLATLSQQLQNSPGGPSPHGPPPPHSGERHPLRGLSRGFAIVTTGNKRSLEKLIEYFNEVEFENRPMTVRFDRFPNYNGYVLQQLNPSLRRSSYGPKNKPGFLSNLAFERNLFQHKYYYGNPPQFQPMTQPMAQPYHGGPVYPNSRSFSYRELRPARANDVTDEEGDSKLDDGDFDRTNQRKTRVSMADLGPPLEEIERSSQPPGPGSDEYVSLFKPS